MSFYDVVSSSFFPVGYSRFLDALLFRLFLSTRGFFLLASVLTVLTALLCGEDVNIVAFELLLVAGACTRLGKGLTSTTLTSCRVQFTATSLSSFDVIKSTGGFPHKKFSLKSALVEGITPEEVNSSGRFSLS